MDDQEKLASMLKMANDAEGLFGDVQKYLNRVIDGTANSFDLEMVNFVLHAACDTVDKMVSLGWEIKLCKYCGKPFVSHSRKERYCSRINETSGMTCSVMGSKATFQKKIDNDPAFKLYNKAYKTRHARMKKGYMSKASLDKWRIQAKRFLEDVRSGRKSVIEYEAWIDKT